MIRKLLTYRHWSGLPSRVYRLVRSPLVPVGEKALFGIPVLLYWILPDALPLVPIDDIAVTLLAMNWFASRAERIYLVKEAAACRIPPQGAESTDANNPDRRAP